MYPMSLISPHYTKPFVWGQMFALTTVRPAFSPPFAYVNPPQTRIEATFSTQDSSTHSSPCSSATPILSPLIKPLVFSRSQWHT